MVLSFLMVSALPHPRHIRILESTVFVNA